MSDRATTLPDDPKARKTYPIATGVLGYFPDALLAVAHVSHVGNEQHNPGEPLHWAREKSVNQDDTMIRHYLQRGEIDTDGCRHTAKMVWRALAMLQLEIEGGQAANKNFGEPGPVIIGRSLPEYPCPCVECTANRAKSITITMAPRPGGTF